MLSLRQAEKFSKVPETKDEEKNYNKNIQKAIELYNEMCMSRDLSVEEKFKVMKSYCKNICDEGNDMLLKYRDMIPFLKGEDRNDVVQLLAKICGSQNFNSFQRILTATTLYNRGHIEICYDCFTSIAFDDKIMVDHRVEAATFLFASEDEDYRSSSQESLLEVISNMEYNSEYRYRIIAKFISRSGISSNLNGGKLMILYDENFVYGLQTNFFYNEKNGLRERILSGQHLWQMNCVDKEEKHSIMEKLLEIARDEDLEINIRADAADVVWRVSTNKIQKKEAHQIIVDLGFDSVDSQNSKDLMGKARTVYNYGQNVHNEEISKHVEKFITKMVNETTDQLKTFEEIHKEVQQIIRMAKLEPEKRFAANKALNRINIDTAKFTAFRITISDILVHVWMRIEKFKPSERGELKKRILDELSEMNDTCSSGHAARLINVLSAFDDTLKISWEDQIKANMTGRMNAQIRDEKDEEIKAQVALGMTKDADKEDRQAYIEYIKTHIPKLKNQLEKEFVDEGYVNSKEFEKSFELGVADWL